MHLPRSSPRRAATGGKRSVTTNSVGAYEVYLPAGTTAVAVAGDENAKSAIRISPSTPKVAS